MNPLEIVHYFMWIFIKRLNMPLPLFCVSYIDLTVYVKYSYSWFSPHAKKLIQGEKFDQNSPKDQKYILRQTDQDFYGMCVCCTLR